MIILTRLGGHEMAVNPDLIERAEPTPDTVITMVDGHKLVVAESIGEVVERIRTWRASVAARAYTLSQDLATAGGWSDDEDDEDENEDDERVTDELAAHSTLHTTLARVLRMPQREE
ncbi:MAG TPA: flagellar FlbD family protein [Kineosporiaceae bacterium]|nr:flagellar FlbD family protein [Kineosporiaceae bacterium]